MTLREHDTVKLTRPLPRTGFGEAPAEGEWPAGTVAALVAEPLDSTVLVEVAGEGGQMLDLFDAPLDALALVTASPGSPDPASRPDATTPG